MLEVLPPLQIQRFLQVCILALFKMGGFILPLFQILRLLVLTMLPHTVKLKF